MHVKAHSSWGARESLGRLMNGPRTAILLVSKVSAYPRCRTTGVLGITGSGDLIPQPGFAANGAMKRRIVCPLRMPVIGDAVNV